MNVSGIMEHLSVIAQEAHSEIQRTLMYVCFAALAVCALIILFEKFGHVLHRIYRDWLHLDGVGRIASVVLVCALSYYGATKQTGIVDKTNSTNSDSGIGLAFVHLELTNVVNSSVSPVTTQTYTMVSIGWTNGTITTSTPFQARNSVEHDWTVLEKVNPTIYNDVAPGGTNMLFFACTNDVSQYVMYWVGSDPPAVIVTSDGIVITSFTVTSTSVSIGWTCDDPKCQTFTVRRRKITNGVAGAWETLISDTSSRSWTMSGFSVDNTWEYQIRGEYYED